MNTHKLRSALIVGARGFGREVLSYIQEDNPLFHIKGFLDSDAHVLNGFNRDVEVIASPFDYQPLDDEVFLAAIGDPHQRFKYTAVLRDTHHVDFATVVHPLANISKYAKIKHGCIIGPRVGVSVDVTIGEFTNIQEYTVIGHDVVIGNWCQINAHCTISGNAKIGHFVSIHPNCVITANAQIGDGVIVGAGSVVIGKIPPNTTIMGNPARRFQFK